MTAPCKGYSPFHVATMLAICETCPMTAACQQSAADAPFKFMEPQVWGGLVLPRDAAMLPTPTAQASYSVDKRRVGRPEWWERVGFDPDAAGSGRHTSSSFKSGS